MENPKGQGKIRNKGRGKYANYSEEFRLTVAKYANENGLMRAVKKFSKSKGTDEKGITKQTVGTWLLKYRAVLHSSRLTGVPQLELSITKQQGRPTLLPPDLDAQLQTYLKQLRANGGVVNRAYVIAAAKGLVIAKNRALLSEFGGSLTLSKTFADSILRRMSFVKRKGTKAARHLPVGFEDIKREFLEQIMAIVMKYDIPLALIVNWDQTGLRILPVSEWTLEEKGAQQVSILGIDDKRQITGVMATCPDGDIVPPQLLYAGKTPKCHPQSVDFPDEWDIHHSESHWSTGDTMLRYVEKIIIPYFQQKRELLGLPHDQEALAIFDVYKAHTDEALFTLLRKNHIKFRFVPARCTSELQPLDADGGLNFTLKRIMNDKFSLWYGEQMAQQLSEGIDVSDVEIDLRLSVLKPLHANWFLDAFEQLRSKKQCVLVGWERTGILEALKSAGAVPEDDVELSDFEDPSSCHVGDFDFETNSAESESKSESTAQSQGDWLDAEIEDSGEIFRNFTQEPDMDVSHGTIITHQIVIDEESDEDVAKESQPCTSTNSRCSAASTFSPSAAQLFMRGTKRTPTVNKKPLKGKKRPLSFDQKMAIAMRKEKKKKEKECHKAGGTMEELTLFERFGPGAM